MNLPTVNVKRNILDKIIYQSKTLDLLFFGLEAGIFELIGYDGLSANEIAQKLDLKPEATEALLNVYVSIELLEKYKNNYVLTPESQEYLLKSSPLYQGDVLQMNRKHQDILEKLPELIKGEKVQSSPKMWLSQDMLEKMAKHALAGMVQNTTDFITSIDDFKNFNRMCDLGGNHGTYSMALIDKNSNLHSEIIDLPHIKPAIEEYITKQGYENKISAIGLDMNNLEELNKNYELVLTSNVLQLWKDDLSRIFKKINSIIKINGIFVSNHFLEVEDSCSNLTYSCFELFTRLRGFSSHFISEEELKKALSENGFGNFKTKKYDYGTIPCLLLSAVKIKE